MDNYLFVLIFFAGKYVFILQGLAITIDNQDNKDFTDDSEDMRLTSRQLTMFDTNQRVLKQKIHKRAINNNYQKNPYENYWPENWHGRVVIKYAFKDNYSKSNRNIIKSAMQEIQSHAPCICLEEVKITAAELLIKNGSGCWSYVGRVAGKDGQQTISLNSGYCMQKHIILHELLHTLGYLHEQNRPDRDLFVKIFYKNIAKNHQSNFLQMKEKYWNGKGTPYDFNSIMHYNSNAFSKNGRRTMEAKTDKSIRLGGIILTSRDVHNLRKTYQCMYVTVHSPASKPQFNVLWIALFLIFLQQLDL